MYGLLTLRYAVIAGLAFLLFYVLFPQKFKRFKIQPLFPKPKDYYREIGYSLLTFVIFALIAWVVYFSPVRPYTRIYTNISDLGWGYFWFSVLLAVIVHDAYFYWTHRLMHHPKLFKHFHLVHHRSTNPSPWAAFAFHPLEALVEVGILAVLVFLFPIHPLAILAFLLIMTVYNVYGHLGYELYPNRFVNSPLGKWLNTATNHNMHHKYFKGNFGLYWRFWDELMGTTHPDYQQTLDNITGEAPDMAGSGSNEQAGTGS